ncbi:hypothetical protein CQ010_16170 [Arthrobacter sp. MYb211]|uniref:TIGR03089 family protein n=1 Tax=unclassified Arthrobacter TaxID=235627 RepID=UPI000CFBBC48|nr:MULTISPECIES: TIGR03089 family protein [unclassified Arthrobacter]PRA09965.1 hypothetical protein CQ015_16155 [Arthrobacter sp. MYb221]PRC05046.1 hypothetical protein CQ010_16170 [Arthrobacter sp. MYb211]
MPFNSAKGAFAEGLLAPRRASATPWLTWYSTSGERIELSGKVFDNWVAKSANLLGEIFDLDEESIVVLDLSAHWKSLVLALASLHHGATLVSAEHGQAAEAQLWITSNPTDERIPGAAEILAVNPAAMALSFGADLGPVAEDYNANVRTYGDQFYPSAVSGSRISLITAGGQELSNAELFAAEAPARGTILVRADIPVLDLLPYAVAQWNAGDTIVLVDETMEVSDRLREGEKISHDYLLAD